MPESTELVLHEPPPTVTLGVIEAASPKALVSKAAEAADALAGVIEQKRLFNTISGRRFVRCEGWTTLAAMMGCLPREESVSEDEAGGYTAVVALVRMTDGAVLTRASAECGMDEETWAHRPAYARRSMAVTRATSKACRIAFSWVMVLAGYEVTPAEEMPAQEAAEPAGPRQGAAAIEERGLPTTLPFGKNKGTPLTAIPDDEARKIIDWCRAKGKFADVVTALERIVAARAASSTTAAPKAQPTLAERPAALVAEKDDGLPF